MSAAFDAYPEERRRSPRIDGAGIKVEYFPEGRKTAAIKSTVKNICVQGICIFMPEVIEVTETIQMKISLPGRNNPILTKGIIVWYGAGGKADTFQAGIEFQEMTGADQKTLLDYLNARPKA